MAVNNNGKELIDVMRQESNRYGEEMPDEIRTHFLVVRDNLNAQMHERAEQYGVDSRSEEFKVAWIMAAATAEEHLDMYLQIWSAMSGVPLREMLPEGSLMGSLVEILES